MLYNNDVFGRFIDPESNPMFDKIQLKFSLRNHRSQFIDQYTHAHSIFQLSAQFFSFHFFGFFSFIGCPLSGMYEKKLNFLE